MITNSSKTIEFQVQQTVSIELTDADIVALRAMLYRMNGANVIPVLKGAATNYIRVRFGLDLKPAEDVVEYLCSSQWLLD